LERVARGAWGAPEGNEMVKMLPDSGRLRPRRRWCRGRRIDHRRFDLGKAQLRATGQVLKFAGYTKVYEVADIDARRRRRPRPPTSSCRRSRRRRGHARERCAPSSLHPARRDSASQPGQGARGARHRTAVDLCADHVDHRRPWYVEKKEGQRFFPTESASWSNVAPGESFPSGVSAEFTARMENELDSVRTARGRAKDATEFIRARSSSTSSGRRPRLRDSSARRSRPSRVRECGKPMVNQVGPTGSFWSARGTPMPQHQGGGQEPRRTYEIGPRAQRRDLRLATRR